MTSVARPNRSFFHRAPLIESQRVFHRQIAWRFGRRGMRVSIGDVAVAAIKASKLYRALNAIIISKIFIS